MFGPTGAFSQTDMNNLSLTVKNIQLPQYELAVNTLNQYNRKRLVQTKINYQPVQVVFHDDGSDLVRNLWYNYFSYYYKDPSQAYNGGAGTSGTNGPAENISSGFDYNGRDIYQNTRNGNDWGFIGESYQNPAAYSNGTDASGKPAFFKDIRIYGLNQHKFAEYVLVNPIITAWQHDQYDYSQGDGMMQNSMTVKYETVKYRSGAISGVRSDTNVKGFGDPANYDTVRSPISRPGSTASVLGQGGLLDTGIGIVEDLQSGTLLGAIGAVQKAGATYNTFKGKSLQSIANEEAIAASKQILQQSLPGAIRGASSVQLFPTPPRANSGGRSLFNFGGVGVSSSGINIGGFNLPF
jgi:hypothetical protein